jgi:AraC-like DNA-binding protein
MPHAIASYRTPPEEVRTLGLAVTGAGCIRGQNAARTKRTLSSYAGVLVTSGTGHVHLHDRPGRFEITPGSYFWLPQGVAHTYGPDGGTWDEIWVLFEGPAARGYEDLGYLAGATSPVATPTDIGSVIEAAQRLVELTAEPPVLAGHLAAAAGLHTLITAVGAAGRHGEAGSFNASLGRRAVEALSKDLAAPVRIGALAKEFAVSRDTLLAAVRAVTGSTPSDYLTRCRLDRAKALLAETDLPVAKIGVRVGYPDPAYFARVFSRHVGLPPGRFRSQSWKPDGESA